MTTLLDEIARIEGHLTSKGRWDGPLYIGPTLSPDTALMLCEVIRRAMKSLTYIAEDAVGVVDMSNSADQAIFEIESMLNHET